jgi:dTDP-glucose pyrophosphorylase/CBS domain-containing protein
MPPSASPAGPAPGAADLCLAADAPLREALARLDRTSKGIVLVTGADGRLSGTITDGDIRRGILAGLTLEHPVRDLLTAKAASPHAHPVTAPAETGPDALLRLMQEHGVRQIPLLDATGLVTGLSTLDELLPDVWPRAQAVIMAGGFGTRLRPYTDDTPKPMLPVGDRPLMERTVRQLQAAGIRRVNVSTHYLAEKIVDHFGDGRAFGVEFTYLREEQPLGTAGALGLMDPPTERCLVINGDILTRVDFRAMLAYHGEHNAALTVGVRTYEMKVPYGVIEADGANVLRVVEKPALRFFVNAGIYVLEPSAHRLIPTGRRFDMTDLIARLIAEGHPVVSFPIVEYWLDIGQQPDYEQAQQDVRTGRYAA